MFSSGLVDENGTFSLIAAQGKTEQQVKPCTVTIVNKLSHVFFFRFCNAPSDTHTHTDTQRTAQCLYGAFN